jgi:hypothetical protein
MSLVRGRLALAALAACSLAFVVPVTADEVGAARRSADPAAPEKPPDRWAPFRAFLGEWEGTSRGSPGNGTVHRQYRLVLGDRFIEVRNRSVYPPQEKNPKGETHEDIGYVSLDRARKVFVLRQFQTYRLEGPDELVEVFELAEPGKEFPTYTETRLRRVR